MKFLLFVGAVIALLWLIRRSVLRAYGPLPSETPAPPVDAALEPPTMLACSVCGLHLPPDQALPGRGGVFCSEAHRRDYEQAHSPP